ncbi:DUF4241 domain-containing protein [Paractinoplanes atraurantiacus]|uniref:DUF4241 domain-containing protein n=1 Tax=Paractinoplanes atraurantiacus TaxID=1036182 RepID=A0A285H117_9ACTN|nr:DUF4241 domain-containing protein [Actinoplanes atraurantiacus]SNY29509.1 Protein of unknown function [Actinoplanes atraurantiacus]
MSYLPDLSALLVEGASFRGGGSAYVMQARNLEAVVLPTGRVVGCDPLLGADTAEPFTVSVAPGTYALRAWVALISSARAVPQTRTAALQLLISDREAARWEMALIPGQDPAELPGDGFFGYKVDASAGALADEVAVRALRDWTYDDYEAVFIADELPPPPSALGGITDKPTGANVISVSTGWGEGVYPTYIGYAADGEPTSYVTDFLVTPVV